MNPLAAEADNERVTTFVIPAGSTGFRSRKAPPWPLVDLKHLRAAWHTGARLAGCKVGELVEQSYPEVYHTATMVGRDGLHIILCHMHHPLVAFVAVRRDWYTTEFIDPPAWATAYSAVGFEPLDADLLLAPFDDADTSQLSAEDWRQIRYWRPPTLGAVLFNRWD